MKPEDSFGPDERFQILADLFKIPLEKAKMLAIEPPFHCDFGTNIDFAGEFYCNFNFTVRIILSFIYCRIVYVFDVESVAGPRYYTQDECKFENEVNVNITPDCNKVHIGTRVMCGPTVHVSSSIGKMIGIK